MSEKVVMNRGKESIVTSQAIDSGAVWFTDEGNLYVDLQNDSRIKVTDVLVFKSEDEFNTYKETHSVKNKLIVISQNGTTKLFIGTSASGSTAIVDSSNKNPFYISTAEFIPYNISYGIGEYSLDKYSLITADGITVNSPENNSFVFDRNNKVGIIKETVDRNVICYIVNNSSNASIESGHQEATYYADKNTIVGTASNGSLFYPYTKWSNILTAKNVYFEKYIKIINNSVGLKINEINDNVTELHIKGEGVSDLITLAIDIPTQQSMSFENIDIVINNEVNKNTLDVNLSSLETIKIINSNVLENCLYLQAKDILIQNATIDKLKIKANRGDGEIIIRNSTINSLEFITDDSVENGVSLKVTIQDSKIKDLEDNNIFKENNTTFYYDDLNIINTEIINKLNINVNTVTFVGGRYCGGNESFKINANTINLGVFDLNGIDISNINGLLNTSSNLTSNRIYDDKERGYGTPEKPYINSHLDAIGEYIDQVRDYVDESADSIKELMQSEYWVSEGVFTNTSELRNEHKEGSILKFVGNSATYECEYTAPYVSLKLFNPIDKIMEASFELANAGYYSKLNDRVNITFKYGKNSQWVKTNGYVSNINSNNTNIVDVRCDIPNELLYISDIADASAKTAELIGSDAIFVHSMQLNNGDRLIKVANGWDKISSSLSNINYNTFSDFNDAINEGWSIINSSVNAPAPTQPWSCYTLHVGGGSTGVRNHLMQFAFSWSTAANDNIVGGSNYSYLLSIYARTNNKYYDSNTPNPNLWNDWGIIWTSSNDGHRSGLDADKIDGLDSNRLARTNSVVLTELPKETGIYTYQTNLIADEIKQYTLFSRYLSDSNKTYMLIGEDNKRYTLDSQTNEWVSEQTMIEDIVKNMYGGDHMRLITSDNMFKLIAHSVALDAVDGDTISKVDHVFTMNYSGTIKLHAIVNTTNKYGTLYVKIKDNANDNTVVNTKLVTVYDANEYDDTYGYYRADYDVVFNVIKEHSYTVSFHSFDSVSAWSIRDLGLCGTLIAAKEDIAN